VLNNIFYGEASEYKLIISESEILCGARIEKRSLFCVIEIDGSQKSGSGTILRSSVALATIIGQPLHIYNIRQNRPQSGLRPQHLEAVLTAAKLCDAEVKGAELSSYELWYKPRKVAGGAIEAEIGTAGSIPMLLMTVLPICVFAENTVNLHVSKGGTDVSNSPTINYIMHVLLPTLRRMGINASLTVNKYGYYPKGMGEVTITVEPCNSIEPILLEEFGELKVIKGVSVCTFLAERKVAERQANTAKNYLKERGYAADIQIINDKSNSLQKGSSLALWTKTSTNAMLGADAIGELRKTSETVGEEAAEKLIAEISTRPTVDVHLADMLIPYVALAKGKSAYLARAMSEHLETNIWLAEKMLNVRFKVDKINGLYRIEKVSY
jgi:RNA 3'-terminal phosphate cyclase (ATP)